MKEHHSSSHHHHLNHTRSHQVSNTLAPLNHAVSAPAMLPLHESQQNLNGEASVNGNPRPGSGRIVLEDDISTRRDRYGRR